MCVGLGTHWDLDNSSPSRVGSHVACGQMRQVISQVATMLRHGETVRPAQDGEIWKAPR